MFVVFSVEYKFRTVFFKLLWLLQRMHAQNYLDVNFVLMQKNSKLMQSTLQTIAQFAEHA